jgi:hypothetical protein
MIDQNEKNAVIAMPRVTNSAERIICVLSLIGLPDIDGFFYLITQLKSTVKTDKPFLTG